MTLSRMVNGEPVAMTEAEESAQRAEWAANDAKAEARRADADAIAYRRARAVAYRDELGAEKGDFINTIGDVIDCLIGELRARGEAVTPEFAAMVAMIDDIKTRHPKPR